VLKCHTGKAINHCHYFFTKKGELVYYNDVEGHLQELEYKHKPEELRIFVDLSKFR